MKKHKFYREFKAVRKLISLVTDEGPMPVFSCSDSGKIITRKKINNPYNQFHPAVIIGRDMHCRIWVAHNHYSKKRPCFDLLEDYLNGQTCFHDNRFVDFNREQVVDRAIFEVLCGDLYHPLYYNGHSFVNNIVWRDVEVREHADAQTASAVLVKFLLDF
jgi:hypothetical protein